VDRLAGALIYEQLTRDTLMGFPRQLVFGDPNPFNGSFLGPPTTTVTSEAGTPGTAAEGISTVLIGDLPVLELPFPNPKRAQ